MSDEPWKATVKYNPRQVEYLQYFQRLMLHVKVSCKV